MANPYHSLRQAVREAFARAPSQHDELFSVPDARIGSTLRIRLPNDWMEQNTQQLRNIASSPAHEDETTFVQEYSLVTERGQADYALVGRFLGGVVLRGRDYDVPLRCLGPGEFFPPDAMNTGTPVFCCVLNDRLWLFPRPDGNYTIQYRTVVDTTAPTPPLPPPAYAPAPWLERERAEKRSMELLYDWLSDAQRKELALEGYFTITGESSGKRYQVHKVHSFGLKELDDDGNVVASFCVVPAGTHALGDTMLAQKIWMETDEETTLARANRMGLAAQALLNAQQLAQYFDQQNAESVLGRTLHGVLPDA